MFRTSYDRPASAKCGYCGDVREVHELMEIDSQLHCSGCVRFIYGDDFYLDEDGTARYVEEDESDD